MLIKNVKIIFPDSIIPGSIIIQNNKIYKIFLNHTPKYDGDILDGENLYLSPGFIDIHIHGAYGCDTMDATCESLKDFSSYIKTWRYFISSNYNDMFKRRYTKCY